MTGIGVDGSRGFASELWNMLNEGGVWGVPRSGLMFRKEGMTFVLQARMPWDPEIPLSSEEWEDFQESDISGIATMMAAIGVTVIPLEI